MTLHALTELIKYKWHAKTRHGIHSPFVYDFIEKLLYKAPPPQNYQELINGISHHYNCKSVCCITHEKDTLATLKPFDLLWLNIADAANWEKAFENNFPLLHANSIVAISNIHKTEKHSAAWASLYKSNKVKLSIDLYGIGLLFFREGFKEKQHFILKYPL